MLLNWQDIPWIILLIYFTVVPVKRVSTKLCTQKNYFLEMLHFGLNIIKHNDKQTEGALYRYMRTKQSAFHC